MLTETIIKALRDGHQTVAAICAATGIGQKAVRRTLGELPVRISRRHVGKAKAAFYTLTE